MSKEMIISASGHETMVAILEDDQVVEIFIERDRSRGVVGNVYKGRVSKVLPGMQSAFVNVGLERDAFLYVTDVIAGADALEPDEDEAEKGNGKNGGGRDAKREGGPDSKIEELLKEGEEILVQVVKEPLGTKGARITSHLSLPGRFLVFM
ncbi:MAG: Rne/Rng family ribonuclease, partial [Vicinamibacterales bacterium]